jgi:kinesin family protein C1
MSMKRPASSMEDPQDGGDGKRQGTTQLSNQSPLSLVHDTSQLRVSRLRGKISKQSLQSQQEGKSPREVSISTALSRLRLDDSENNSKSKDCKKATNYSTGSVRTPKNSSYPAMRKSKLDNSHGAPIILHPPDDSLVASLSRVPIRSRIEAQYATPATPSKATYSSPVKTPYLTKNSNITAFTAWDVHGRIEDMETMYSELKGTLKGINMERNGLEEAAEQYKLRCK